MMGQCAIHVDNNLYLESDGNVQNVKTTTFALYVTMVINTISDTDFIELHHQDQKGGLIISSNL